MAQFQNGQPHRVAHFLTQPAERGHFNRALVLCALALLIALSSLVPDFVPELRAERRGMWVVAHTLESRESIDECLRFAQSLRITDLIVQVRSRGDAYYETSLAPRAEILKSQPQFDPLAYVLKQAGRSGIRVHAWMNVYLLWSNPRAPSDRSHPIIRNASWLSQSAQTPRRNTGMDMVRELRGRNLEGAYISPAHPAARRYLLEIIGEVLRKYRVHGLHLDYIRYAHEDYGFEEPMQLAFQRQFGVTPSALMWDSQGVISKYGQSHFQRLVSAWEQFRCQQITDLVSSVRTLVQRQNPAPLLSMAVRPETKEARIRFGQDWGHWANTGLLDKVLPMNYTPDDQLFIDRTRTMLQDVPRQMLWMGVATYNQTGSSAAAKILQMRTLGLSDYVLFSYSSSRAYPQLLQMLR
jgi:uncharacterized lipoprotein YddW (UPF0748 family)